MAHPKRKHSHSRTKKKQTHQKLNIPSLVVCSECKKMKPAHMVCPFCGYYRGKQIIVVKKKEKKKKR
ncbi:MAG: 50S ribosomal protein L32 [Candidatus Omnitrophica bacterium]|nr:50S ribosomal protein L32 [Candidatus Omnitrophota bacterium]